MEQSAGLLFALEGSRDYGERLASRLEWPLSVHEEREFEDGEHKIGPLCDISRRDVFVVHSLYGSSSASPNDKLCRMLFFIGALKNAGAARVTAVAPYPCYVRKDLRSQPLDRSPRNTSRGCSRPAVRRRSSRSMCTTPPHTRTPTAARR